MFQSVIDTMLKRVGDGYVFIPFGQLGKTFLVPAQRARAVVWGCYVFGYTIVPLMAGILLTSFYYKVTNLVWPVLTSLVTAVGWIAVFYLWAKIVTRNLEICDGFSEGGEA